MEQREKRRTAPVVYKSGENHPNWKGDFVGYAQVHQWVKKNKPKPEFCEHCHRRLSKDLHNKSKTYKRNINDYQWLCHKCHMKLDGISEKLRHQGNRFGKGNELWKKVDRNKLNLQIKKWWDSPEGLKERENRRKKYTGIGNPFYGKHHTKKKVEKY